MFLIIASGLACPNASVANSNLTNTSGFYMDEYVATCNEGYTVNNVTTSQTIMCTENAEWNMLVDSCESKNVEDNEQVNSLVRIFIT